MSVTFGECGMLAVESRSGTKSPVWDIIATTRLGGEAGVETVSATIPLVTSRTFQDCPIVGHPLEHLVMEPVPAWTQIAA